MPKLPYHVQGENATSVCILRAWLRDVGIPFALPESSDHDLIVTTADGGSLHVHLGDSVCYHNGVEVRAKDFTGKKDEVALAAFYVITDAAGYPRRKPSIRDAAVVLNERGNPRKLHYRDEEFLVAIRHNEFRRAPNPDDGVWQQYKAVMEEAVWWFLRGMTHNTSHFEMCTRHGIEMADLMSYARCYVVNFVGRYETATPVACDNERKCYEYIKQRLKYDLLPILWRKERSMIPDAETVRVALFGSSDSPMTKGSKPEPFTPDPTDVYIHAIDNPEAVALARAVIHTPRPATEQEVVEDDGSRRRRRKTSAELAADEVDDALDAFLSGRGEDYDYISRNCELDTSSVAARQRTATERLETLLRELPHDQMVESLTKTSKDYKFDTPTRREARRRLSEHIAHCRPCTRAQNETPEQRQARQARNRRKRLRQMTLGSK